MNVIIKKAKIIEENSKFHNLTKDIQIINGKIALISDSITDPSAKIIANENLHLSPGWVDLKTATGDPGFEHKETIQSTLELSAQGGFTNICALPSNNPVNDSKAQAQYLLNKSAGNIVNLFPIGCISKGMNGEELSEMFDLQNSGCLFFSDDNNYINTGLMYRALLYSKQIQSKVSFNLTEPYLSSGIVHEGLASLKTGLKLNSPIGEIIQLEKIIRLVEYVQGSVHISGISLSESVDLINNAKKRGLNITCDVNIMNLIFSELDVLDFNSMMKVFPVLRSEKDKIALNKGVDSGVIDFIVSDHRPVDLEDKELEFDQAKYGCYQLQTMFSALLTFSNLSMEKIIFTLGQKNRSFLLNSTSIIDLGQEADLTIFSPSENTLYNESVIRGNRKLNPFYNKELKGKVIGIVNNNQIYLNANEYNS